MAETENDQNNVEDNAETTTKPVERSENKLDSSVRPREASEVNQLVQEHKERSNQKLLDEVTEEATIVGAAETVKSKKSAKANVGSNLKVAVYGLGVVLAVLSCLVGYLGYEVQNLKTVHLSQKEIVFYPFDEANQMLKAQGYDFKAVQVYNRNMISILNDQGKVVLPKATIHGQVPKELVVELMSVDEMNALAGD